jgi:hypothetical protein
MLTSHPQSRPALSLSLASPQEAAGGDTSQLSATKRPRSAYLFFLAHFRAQHRGMRQRDICAAAGSAWRGLIPDQRAPYEEQAALTRAAWRDRADAGPAAPATGGGGGRRARPSPRPKPKKRRAHRDDSDSDTSGESGSESEPDGGFGASGDERGPRAGGGGGASSSDIDGVLLPSPHQAFGHLAPSPSSSDGMARLLGGAAAAPPSVVDSARLLGLYQLESLLERSSRPAPPFLAPSHDPTPIYVHPTTPGGRLSPAPAPAGPAGGGPPAGLEDSLAAALALFGDEPGEDYLLPLYPLQVHPAATFGAPPRRHPAAPPAPLLPRVDGWAAGAAAEAEGDGDALLDCSNAMKASWRNDPSAWIPNLGPTPRNGSLEAAAALTGAL